jgi:hypothetical protein
MNYIKIILARKLNDTDQNKCQFIKNNSITIFLKIKHIEILLEKYYLHENRSEKNNNFVTFFIMKNENESFNTVDSNKQKKMKVLVVFDHEYYKKAVGIIPKNETIYPEINRKENSYYVDKLNNELIQGIIVCIFLQ